MQKRSCIISGRVGVTRLVLRLMRRADGLRNVSRLAGRSAVGCVYAGRRRACMAPTEIQNTDG